MRAGREVRGRGTSVDPDSEKPPASIAAKTGDAFVRTLRDASTDSPESRRRVIS